MQKLSEAQQKLANDLMALVCDNSRMFADFFCLLIPAHEYMKHLDLVGQEVLKLAAMAEVKE